MISLRFSRGTGVAGAIVRWATWSPFAHVGFKLDNGKVLDATPEYGVSVRDAEDDKTTQYWRILAPKQHISDAVEYARLQVGKPYDWTAIYGMAARRDWHRDDKFFCSEIVEAAFDHVHWPLVRDFGKLNRITPRDLLLSMRIMRVK